MGGYSFGNVEGNQKAICDQGWYPYNQNLLLHPELQSTMTEAEKMDAVSQKFIGPNVSNENPNVNLPNMNSSYLSTESCNSQSLNYSSGVAAYCAESLLGHENLMQIKAEMNQKQKISKDIKEVMSTGKKISAGLCYKSGTCHLGKSLLDLQKEKVKSKQQELQKAAENEFGRYINRKSKAIEIMQKKPDVMMWNKKDLEIIIMFFKRKGDEARGKTVEGLRKQYHLWKHRTELTIDDFVCQYKGNNSVNDYVFNNEDDDVAAL